MLKRFAIAVAALYLLAGCKLIPVIEEQPTFHNPFPQISRVGVAPFFVLTNPDGGQPDGRQVALAYFNELQTIPGFEVTPIGIIEGKAKAMGIELRGYDDVRRVAKELDLDAVIVGAITDFSPYYPPRMALQVDWIATNPAFHPIPTGYGLPWGTPEEEEIPQNLLEATEFELAREQLRTQTPDSRMQALRSVPGANGGGPPTGVLAMVQSHQRENQPRKVESNRRGTNGARRIDFQKQLAGDDAAPHKHVAQPLGSDSPPPSADSISSASPGVTVPVAGGQLPMDWPDPSGLTPAPPSAQRPPFRASDRPIMTYTRNFNGHDANFTQALQNYYDFRDDARFGGWQSYLQRSDDFIRFCCHMHLTEMLTARGGAGETRVVWHWFNRR